MRIPFILAAFSVLAACGDTPASETAKTTASPGLKVDCSGVGPAKAPQGQPTDDVLGVRAGLGYDQARTVLQCANRAYRFEETGAGFPLPTLPDGRAAKLSLFGQAGKIAGCDPNDASTLSVCVAEHPRFERVDDAVQVLFTGSPGQEKVIAVGRTLSYPEGGERDLQGLLTDLKSKYGPGVVQTAAWSRSSHLTWVFDSSGQPLTQANPDLADCANTVGFGQMGPGQIREGCRLTINATLTLKPDNPGLVRELTVVSVDQASAHQQIEAARAAIQALSDQARAQEVERARSQGAGGRL